MTQRNSRTSGIFMVGYQEVKYNKKLVDNKIAKLIIKMTLKTNKLCFDVDRPAKQRLKEAFLFIEQNWSQCKKDLIHTLLEVQNENDKGINNKLFSNEDHEKLVSYISDSITNLSLKINGKGTQ